MSSLLWRGSIPKGMVVTSILFATFTLGASFPIVRGRRWAAVAVLALFGLDKAILLFQVGLAGLWNGIALNAILAFSLAQGVWGAYALAAVEQDRTSVPPMPAETAG